MCAHVTKVWYPYYFCERRYQNLNLHGFDRKNRFFDEKFWFKFNNLGLAVGTNLKFYTNVRLKLKLRKFLGLIPTFIEVTVEKQVRR